MNPLKKLFKPKPRGVDIQKLKEDHPNDPRIGQGYNDARGEVPDDAPSPTHKNIKNNLGPQQKRRRLAKITTPAAQAGYVPSRRKK
jgi:hypothetical protein